MLKAWDPHIILGQQIAGIYSMDYSIFFSLMNRAPKAYCGCFLVYMSHVAAVISFCQHPLPPQHNPPRLKHRCCTVLFVCMHVYEYKTGKERLWLMHWKTKAEVQDLA